MPGPFYVQRRALFAFNFNPPTAPRSSTLRSELGLKQMRDLVVSEKTQDRVPDNDVLTRAYQSFFVSRAENPGIITQFHEQLLSSTWYHLQARESELESEDWDRVFSDESLGNVLYVLSKAECLPHARSGVRRLADSVFLALCRIPQFGRNELDRLAILAYVDIQASYGHPVEAQQTLERYMRELHKMRPKPWLAVMKGYALGGCRDKLKRLANRLRKFGVSFDSASQEELIHFLIGQDHLGAAKLIYDCPLSGHQEPYLSTSVNVIKFALLKRDTAWAQAVMESLPSDPFSETIGIQLLWKAYQGENALQINRTVQSLTAKEPIIRHSITISCVNDLMEYANSISDPTLAFEFMDLASLWDLTTNSRTRVLHLEALVQAGDLNGVLRSLEDMEDLKAMGPDILPFVNRLITILCSSGRDDVVFDRISSILEPLLESDVRLEAATLTALTRMLLDRLDLEAVSELLRPRLGSFDDYERYMIRTAFTDFIKDPNQESDPAWEAYMLLQLAFPETSRDVRTRIMSYFFQRDRSDLAFLVFGHMRQAENFAHRPNTKTYARCFRGIAYTRDAKNLELVHNMLKLDTEVDLNTRLLNSLMLAYAECEKPEKAMQVFRDILQSEEGPTSNTVHFFFKICEKHHNGTHEAMKMIEKLKVLDIDLDRRLYTAYVEALAAQCELELATEALDVMKEVTGHQPDAKS